MTFYEMVYWDNSYNNILLTNLVIAVAFFASIRLFSGIIAHIDASKELFEKDNPAFGISMSGVILAITIMLTGAIYGDPINNLSSSIASVAIYGFVGIILLALSRVIFNYVAFTTISIRDEIVKGNIAVGIVDAGNVVATAIVIHTVMVWIGNSTFDGIQAVLIAFVISQIFLTLTTYLRIKVFKHRNDGKTLQENLRGGNVALAMRFAGRKIGTAFAISAASNIMAYEVYEVETLMVGWFFVSIFMVAILTALSWIADKIILFGVDTNKEIIEQRNAALGVLQCVIYISLGILLEKLVA